MTTKAKARKPKMIVVTRDCCTSGNCITCARPITVRNKGVFTPQRVEHWRGTDKDRADTIVRNWSAYNARIEP